MTKDQFLAMCRSRHAFRQNGTLNASFIKYLKNRPELLAELNTFVSAESVSEQLFLLTKKRTFCEVCGAPTEFRNYGEGYQRFCSAECRRRSLAKKAQQTSIDRYGPDYAKIRAQKSRQTIKNKYGVDSAFDLANKKPTANVAKQRATMLQKYGVEHPLQSDAIKAKVRQTHLDRYGATRAVHADSVQQALTAAHLKKHGVAYATQRIDIKSKIKAAKQRAMYARLLNSDRLKQRVLPMFTLEQYEDRMKDYPFKCTKCSTVFNDSLRDGKIPRCPTCYPTDYAARNPREDEVASYIKSIAPTTKIILNDRVVLQGKELDIYLPQYKVAIEYNELWWHSEAMGRGKHYHLSKSKLCEAQGIRLLHIFEDEWIHKQDVVQSIIAAAMGVYQKQYQARKLTVVMGIGTKQFFDDNHIQGSAASSISVALCDGNDIIAAIALKKPRYSKEADYELIRYAVKKHCSVIGGFPRLLSHFRSSYGGSIVTYSDRRLFQGNVYRAAGFCELPPTEPDYWYSKNYTERESRIKYQKHKLVDADKSLTEWENMQLGGYGRIWGCGSWKFILR